MPKSKEITLEEFQKQFCQPAKDWDFNLFSIVCKKCGSSNVEYNGKLEIDSGWYGAQDAVHFLVIKCHDCGNAHAMSLKEDASSYYCPSCDH
jgi:ribosomal protein S27E